MHWLNKFGRRKTLLVSLVCMGIGLLILGIWPEAPVWIILFAFSLYAFFSGAPGILQWLYPNELFPTEIRATAVGVAIGFSRIGTIISTSILPWCLVEFGIGPTMLAGAALVLFALLVSLAFAPETLGKTLKETSALTEKELAPRKHSLHRKDKGECQGDKNVAAENLQGLPKNANHTHI